MRARVVGKATLIAKRDVLEVRVNRSDFGLPPYGPLFLGGPHEVRHRGLVEQDQDTILGAIREFTHAVALEPAHPLIAFWAAGYFVLRPLVVHAIDDSLLAAFDDLGPSFLFQRAESDTADAIGARMVPNLFEPLLVVLV